MKGLHIFTLILSFTIGCWGFTGNNSWCSDNNQKEAIRLPLKYRFSNYRVNYTQYKKKAPIIIPPDASSEASELKKKYFAGKINFAGHFIFIPLSCGMGCEAGGVVDVLTGQAYPLPGGVSDPPDLVDYNFKRIDFRLDSALIILTGNINEVDTHPGKLVRHYFVFERDGFKKIGYDILSFDKSKKQWADPSGMSRPPVRNTK